MNPRHGPVCPHGYPLDAEHGGTGKDGSTWTCHAGHITWSRVVYLRPKTSLWRRLARRVGL